jgi:hypothetical protein
MEQTQNHTQTTSNGAQNGKPIAHLRLPDLPEFKLGADGDLNGFDASNVEFSQFAHSLVPIKGDSEQWTWEERRDFLNWCLDEQVLTIAEKRLVPVEDPEEKTPTAPLQADSEETGFLHDVERARPVMRANPEINAKGLADALGLKSVIYAQTVKVYVNAHKSAEEEQNS